MGMVLINLITALSVILSSNSDGQYHGEGGLVCVNKDEKTTYLDLNKGKSKENGKPFIFIINGCISPENALQEALKYTTRDVNDCIGEFKSGNIILGDYIDNNPKIIPNKNVAINIPAEFGHVSWRYTEKKGNNEAIIKTRITIPLTESELKQLTSKINSYHLQLKFKSKIFPNLNFRSKLLKSADFFHSSTFEKLKAKHLSEQKENKVVKTSNNDNSNNSVKKNTDENNNETSPKYDQALIISIFCAIAFFAILFLLLILVIVRKNKS